ncbi:MAG: ATP-binding protein [Bacteroidota bacterium]
MRAFLLLLLFAAMPASGQEASGFVEAGGRLVHFEVVRDSFAVFGQGVEGRPRVTIPYAAFVDALERSARAGALAPDSLAGPEAVPFALAVDDRAVVRLATAVPVGTLALGLLGAGLIALVGGAVVWERRARKARRLRAEFRRRLAAAREAERAHVARELHDGPVQDLCAVQMTLGEPGAEAAREAVTGVVGELRALCDELRPSALDAFGLTAALASLADRAAAGPHATDVRFRMDPVVRPVADGSPLSDEKRLALYRIAQEALNNALQHAGASRIDVALAFDDRTLTLTVDDDGAGPPEADALELAARGHYGLLGMQERADLLRADLAVARGPLGGTRVALALPIPAHRLDALAADV